MFLSIFSISAPSVVAFSAVIDRNKGAILRKAFPRDMTASLSSDLKVRPILLSTPQSGWRPPVRNRLLTPEFL